MSIWLTESFIGAELCKNGRWMRTLLSEKGGYGGFSFVAWKGYIFICSKMHAVLADLPFHRSNTKLGPAWNFAVDSVSNAPGSLFRLWSRQQTQISQKQHKMYTTAT